MSLRVITFSMPVRVDLPHISWTLRSVGALRTTTVRIRMTHNDIVMISRIKLSRFHVRGDLPARAVIDLVSYDNDIDNVVTQEHSASRVVFASLIRQPTD